jgi:hypothetical protein
MRFLSGSHGGEYEVLKVFWEVAPYSHVEIDRRFRSALMMEAVRTSETSVNFNVTTRRYIP